MAFTTLTMKRRGQFVVDLTGEHFCGVERRNVFKYEVEITMLSEAIDDRGFLVDQLEIAGLFKEIKSTNLSCELLAKDLARKCFATILKSSSRESILRIACTISPMPEAEMTFVWQKYTTCVR